MHFKSGSREFSGASNGTVTMESGDMLSVAYTDPRGKAHIFNITAQHLVMMVSHEATESAILCRPAGVEFISDKGVTVVDSASS